MYISVPSPFPALEEFIQDTVKTYNLDLYHCSAPDAMPVESVVTPAPASAPAKEANGGGAGYVDAGAVAVGKAKGAEGMRRALADYKERFPHVDAILVGTRRGDPHGGMTLTLTRMCRPALYYADCFFAQQNFRIGTRQIHIGHDSCVYIQSSTGRIQTYGRSCGHFTYRTAHYTTRGECSAFLRRC